MRLTVSFKDTYSKSVFKRKNLTNYKGVKGLPQFYSIKDQFLCYIDLQGGQYNVLSDNCSEYLINISGSEEFLKQAKKDFKKWVKVFNIGFKRAGLKFKLEDW